MLSASWFARPRIEWTSWATIFICCVAVFYAPLRFHTSVFAVGLEDDFFYYAKAAHNLAFHGVSTFDGVHPTNGYHPLWMLVLTGLSRFFDPGGVFHARTIYPYAIALQTVQILVVLLTSHISLRLARLFCGVAASVCIQLLITSWVVVMVRTGMEVGLTVFLMLLLLWYRLRPMFRWSPDSCLLYGVLAAMMILSRLDTILFAFLLVAVDVVPSVLESKRWSNVLMFVAGLSPVALYVASNEFFFRTHLPVSGTAKQLHQH